MRRFVSLASDEKATYAAHLPVAAKLWTIMGFEPIVQHSLDESNPFEAVVLKWTCGRLFRIDARAPLSLRNTMRNARLFAWERAPDEDDFVLTSDADMYPLSKAYFARELPPHVFLRAAWYLWLGQEGREPVFDPARLEPTGGDPPFRSHFAMCYAGATKAIWRELFPAGDWPTTGDGESWDEEALTARALTRVRGGAFEELARGRWRRGDLFFDDPLDAPLLSRYRDFPRGLLGPEDREIAETFPEGALDLIPPRFTRGEAPNWVFPVVAHYVPEISDWMSAYLAECARVIGSATWPN